MTLVFVIIDGQFATNQDSVKRFNDMYLFVVANFIGVAVQFAIRLPIFVFLMTQAYMFAFDCYSSLDINPHVTLGCIRKGCVRSQSLSEEPCITPPNELTQCLLIIGATCQESSQ